MLSLCLDPININSVLDALGVSLLAVSHFSIPARSSFKTVLLPKVMCVSSAYMRGSEFDRQLGKSLI